MLKYFNDRMATEGVEETDGQLAKLGKLLFSKRNVSFQTDQWDDTKLAARIISARRAYAGINDIPITKVTKRILQDSTEGLQ